VSQHFFGAKKIHWVRAGSPIATGENLEVALGRVFNFKLDILSDNTINPLNANGHF